MPIKELYKSITGGEWKFWAKILAATIILTSLSRFLVVLITPSDYEWRGNVIFSHVDRYVYASYIEQARGGKFFFQDLYTAKEESVPMFNVFWLGAGLFARLTHLSANATLEFLRLLMIPLLLFVLYLLIAYLIENIQQRKIAYLLSALGGGVGTILLPIISLFFDEKRAAYNLPLDIDTAEAFVYLINYYSAHFIFSAALFLGIMLLTLLAIDAKKMWYALPAGAASLILSNFHPFTFIILFFVFFSYFVYLLWAERGKAWFLIRYALLLGLITLPSIAYHFYMFKTPWWQAQTWHSTTYTPNPVSIIAGYGFILAFAVYSLWLSYRGKIKIGREKFLLIWFASQATMFFLPVSVQRRFFEGYAVCLAILASYSLSAFLVKRPWIAKGKIFVSFSFVVLFGLSFALVTTLDLRNIFIRGNVMYVPKESFKAMRTLKVLSEEDDLILADIYNAAMIPGVALRRVYVGHGTETINYDVKYATLLRFMKSTDAEEREAILKNNKIKFVFYDAQWKKDWAWNPEGAPFLEKIYWRGNYMVYRVK